MAAKQARHCCARQKKYLKYGMLVEIYRALDDASTFARNKVADLDVEGPRAMELEMKRGAEKLYGAIPNATAMRPSDIARPLQAQAERGGRGVGGMVPGPCAVPRSRTRHAPAQSIAERNGEG